MPSTTSTRPTSSINYCFLLKCLAGVALAGFIIAMLMKPTYIVAAAATALAPALGTVIFLPLVALLTVTLIVGLAASLSSATYVPRPRATVAYPWYQPAGWFGPRYANSGWFDYMFDSRPANYHSRNASGTSHFHNGGTVHRHASGPSSDSRATTHSHDGISRTSASPSTYHSNTIFRTNSGTGVPPNISHTDTRSLGGSHHGHR